MSYTAANPNTRRRLRERLLALTPRAFELFAGDLLTYVGLQNVAVTRFSGDGGIDAHGDLFTESGLVHIRAGVQVKRYRRNVRRPDIDQLIGAYGGTFDRGIFITTAGYAAQARQKAATSPLLRVDTVDGDQVAALMLRHRLGIVEDGADPRLDEPYFLSFEARSGPGSPATREAREPYIVEDEGAPVAPEEDLISLTALSYALRVDRGTARGWVERGRLIPDRQVSAGARDTFFFRRDRVDDLRRQLLREPAPASGAEWRQAFLDFARSRNLSRSYKPVLLQALLALVDRSGEARLEDLARAFHAFYLQRQRDGLPAERDGIMARPDAATLEQVAQLIVKFPLDRFLIQQLLEYEPASGLVRVAPQLWQELRVSDLRDAQASAEEQIRFYFRRGVAE
ncbi:MAG: hypothetical protein RLZZ387_2708 [Chloroflexota bacterium]|jgi:hypothetical protein